MLLNKVTQSLLAPSQLALQDLSNIFDQLSHRHLDYADLYFQLSQDENWVLEDSIIKEGGFHIDRGVGVRAVSGEKRDLPILIKLHSQDYNNAPMQSKVSLKSNKGISLRQMPLNQ